MGNYINVVPGTGSTIQGGGANANFDPPDGGGYSCQTTVWGGNCTALHDCTGTPPTPVPVGDGPLQISGVTLRLADGGLATNALLTLYPDDGGINYLGYLQRVPLWQGGETLTFASAGGTFGAFSGQLTAPNMLVFETVPLDGGPLFFSPGTDATLAWDGGGAGTLTFFLIPNNSPNFVTCVYPANAGAGTVPGAVFTWLDAGAGHVVTAHTSVATVQADAGVVTLSAGFSVVKLDGTDSQTVSAIFGP